MTTHSLKAFKPPKTQNGGVVLGIFQPNWQNHKITSTAKIGWTPNFDRVIKLHG